MLFLFTILVVLLGTIALTVFVKRLITPRLLEENNRNNLAAENFRPLFAPSDEDVRSFEAEEKARLAVKLSDEQDQILAEKFAKLEEVRQNWRASSNRANTIQVLYGASQTEQAQVYIEVSENVLEAWRAGKIADLTADDLAQLLESHFWLLPTNVAETTSLLSRL